MPLYEYQCDACGHRVEVIQKYADAPITVCPACGGAVTKLFSSPAIQFKGSGFYLTDYGRGGKTDAGTDTGDKASSGGTEKKSESTGDSKAVSNTESSGGSKGEKSDAKADAKTEKKSDATPGGSSATSGGSSPKPGGSGPATA